MKLAEFNTIIIKKDGYLLHCSTDKGYSIVNRTWKSMITGSLEITFTAPLIDFRKFLSVLFV